jgi:hypothetical protein
MSCPWQQLCFEKKMRSQRVWSLAPIKRPRSRRGLHPIAMSILGGPGEVSVHQVASFFPSLPSCLKEHSLVPSGRRMLQGAPVKRISCNERVANLRQGMLTRPAWSRARHLTQSPREAGGRQRFCQMRREGRKMPPDMGIPTNRSRSALRISFPFAQCLVPAQSLAQKRD